MCHCAALHRDMSHLCSSVRHIDPFCSVCNTMDVCRWLCRAVQMEWSGSGFADVVGLGSSIARTEEGRRRVGYLLPVLGGIVDFWMAVGRILDWLVVRLWNLGLAFYLRSDKARIVMQIHRRSLAPDREPSDSDFTLPIARFILNSSFPLLCHMPFPTSATSLISKIPASYCRLPDN